MIAYDLLYVFYINDVRIYMSDRLECFDLADVQVLQMEGGERIEEYIRRGFEEHAEQWSNGLRYTGTRMYLANPDRSDQYYASNRNSPDLIHMNVNATAAEVRRVSNRHFSAARKPLIMLQMSYVEC